MEEKEVVTSEEVVLNTVETEVGVVVDNKDAIVTPVNSEEPQEVIREEVKEEA